MELAEIYFYLPARNEHLFKSSLMRKVIYKYYDDPRRVVMPESAYATGVSPVLYSFTLTISRRG